MADDPAQIAADTERYKARLDFWKAVVVTGVIGASVTALGSVLSWSVQWKQAKVAESESQARIALDRQERDAKLKLEAQQAEHQYLERFLEEAMEEDLKRRMRFAHYFASVALSSEFRANWSRYLTDLKTEQEAKEAELQREVDELKSKLAEVSARGGEVSPPEQFSIQASQTKIANLQTDLGPGARRLAASPINPLGSPTEGANAMLRNLLVQHASARAVLEGWLRLNAYTVTPEEFLAHKVYSEGWIKAARDLLPAQDLFLLNVMIKNAEGSTAASATAEVPRGDVGPEPQR